MAKGLFVGLATLDVIHLVAAMPGANEKIRAEKTLLEAGGPALNAAVAFAHPQRLDSRTDLDRWDEAMLVTRIGDDGVGELIRSGISSSRLQLLEPGGLLPASTVASIMVNKTSGDRAIVSFADGRDQEQRVQAADFDCDLGGVEIVLSDGYHPDLALRVLRASRAAGITTVLDGGSRKSYTEQLLPYVDIAVVSEQFAGTDSSAETFAYLSEFGIEWMALTRGEKPLEYRCPGGSGELEAERVKVADTLGAGDFFHGGFAKAIAGKELNYENFIAALKAAALIAAKSVQSFGTRDWLD